MYDTITATQHGERPVPANEPALVCREADFAQKFHYWLGESGTRYLHTVFPLVGCPLIPKVNYILVRRDGDGTRRPLGIGQTVSDADSLNLAHLRHKAALLGANEIHVHFLARTPRERAHVEADLSARQIGRPVPVRAFRAANDEAAAEAICV